MGCGRHRVHRMPLLAELSRIGRGRSTNMALLTELGNRLRANEHGGWSSQAAPSCLSSHQNTARRFAAIGTLWVNLREDSRTPGAVAKPGTRVIPPGLGLRLSSAAFPGNWRISARHF
jgi:hypothetical protein